MIVNKFTFLFILGILFLNSISFANEADVTQVEIKKDSNNSFNFSVTILHKDTGWEHYANKWEILGEQPFTRTLYGVKVPDSVKIVTIQAHDSVHKYGGKVLSIKLHD